MHTATCAGIALLAAALIGCDPEEEESGNNKPPAHSGDGDEATVDGDGDGTESPDVEDPFCSHAQKGFAALDDYLAVMNELSLTGEEIPASRINENGLLGVSFAEDFGEHMADAAGFVIDEEAAAAFDQLLIYQADYMSPQASLAATASSDMQYGMDSLELIQQPGVAEAAAGGAVASGVARQYALGRCGPFE